MNSFSWIKVIFFGSIIWGIGTFGHPVETVATNRTAATQLNQSDADYVNWIAWNSTPDKTGAICVIVALVGIISMTPEIRRALKRPKAARSDPST